MHLKEKASNWSELHHQQSYRTNDVQKFPLETDYQFALVSVHAKNSAKTQYLRDLRLSRHAQNTLQCACLGSARHF